MAELTTVVTECGFYKKDSLAEVLLQNLNVNKPLSQSNLYLLKSSYSLTMRSVESRMFVTSCCCPPGQVTTIFEMVSTVFSPSPK